MEDDGLGKLGFWSIALMYLSIAFGSIFSTVIMKRIGDINCMAIGSLFNTPWIMSMALCGMRGDLKEGDLMPWYLTATFITPLILILSILNGLGQGIQWVGQGKYVSDCATEETKGFFFSYFWAFYMSS